MTHEEPASRKCVDLTNAEQSGPLTSGPKIAMVRALSEQWNAGERSADAIAEAMNPEIELEGPLSSLAGEPYRGYEGIKRWMADLDEQFSEWRMTLDDVLEVGGQVIVIGGVDARGRASGVALRLTAATVFAFADDMRIRRVRIYADVDEGLKAVGLAQ